MNQPKTQTLSDIFEKVKTFFREEPLRFDMDTWCSHPLQLTPVSPPCGTIGCLAYGIVTVTENAPYAESYASCARRILGIDETLSELLFYVENWPQPYKSDYIRSQADFTLRLVKIEYENQDPDDIAVCKYLKERMVITLCLRLDYFLAEEAPLDA
jgi:hypothetical protein